MKGHESNSAGRLGPESFLGRGVLRGNDYKTGSLENAHSAHPFIEENLSTEHRAIEGVY